jgi:hypothetical protein
MFSPPLQTGAKYQVPLGLGNTPTLFNLDDSLARSLTLKYAAWDYLNGP